MYATQPGPTPATAKTLFTLVEQCDTIRSKILSDELGICPLCVQAEAKQTRSSERVDTSCGEERTELKTSLVISGSCIRGVLYKACA